MKRSVLYAFLLSVTGFGGLLSVHAATFNSSNFSINGNIGDSAAGGQSSTSYKLTSAAGESISGEGSSGSYKLGQGYIPQLNQSMELGTQPDGQLFYFPFDEGAGSVAYDSAANAYNAVLGNSPTWTSGRVGGALSLSTNQFAMLPDKADLLAKKMTIDTWLKPDLSQAGTQTIASTKESGGFALTLVGNSVDGCGVDTLCFRVYVGGTYRKVEYSETVLTNNQWNHVVATYDGADLKLYVNGSNVATTNFSGTAEYDPSVKFCVGSEASLASCQAGSYLYGSLDEFRYFNRALSGAEISAEYTNFVNGAQAVALPNLTPGSPVTATFDSVVKTDGAGYTLGISQNNDLTSGGNTIPAIGGSIGSPLTWNDGTTKGLGFTLYSTTATALPGTWSSGNAYAALPGSPTTFYTRTGLTGGATDTIGMRFKLDTLSSQVSGNYTNQMIITGTITP